MSKRLHFSSNAAQPVERNAKLRLVLDHDHYDLLLTRMLRARVSVWIATANVKEVMVEAPIGSTARARNRFVSLLDGLSCLASAGVELRLLHATPPSRAFCTSLRRHKSLASGGLAMRRCPRVHMKVIVLDGAQLYIGSANLTGAGLGAKSDKRRNFEIGLVTEDDVLLDLIQARFDRIWRGAECKGCRVRSMCESPIDTIATSRR